ncbi:MAG: alpha/beta fold hydrolase [Pseudomonadota bacterium]
MTAVTLTHIQHDPEGTEQAPPLVIAHGLYGSARNFNSLGKKLAAGRRVIMVDMRNHGSSPWAEAMTYSAMAADLADAVERLASEPALVLGHSMGGKAAMALALSRPDLVAALVVADIAPVSYDHSHEGYIDAMLSVDLSRVARRSDAEPMLAGSVPEPMLRSFLLQNLLIEDGRARWRLNLDVLKTDLPNLMDWPATWPHQSFDGPTLFLHGGASDYVTKEMHPAIRKLFPKVEFETLAGTGHWLHAEKPTAFVAALSGWIGARP